ncbi:hypothetical protein ACJX0J_030404, partial [Zea mays]
ASFLHFLKRKIERQNHHKFIHYLKIWIIGLKCPKNLSTIPTFFSHVNTIIHVCLIGTNLSQPSGAHVFFFLSPPLVLWYGHSIEYKKKNEQKKKYGKKKRKRSLLVSLFIEVRVKSKRIKN